MKNRKKIKRSTLKLSGERKIINGEKVLILPCVDREFKSKKRRFSSGQIARKYRNL